ncbi:L-ribulose-5-phosphate 3-epimerase [Listeria rustica]|uniref:L-ribulose-5-phosphate 3-epimerase n=1 Tax=Listeria rustica TaxID=2713503 RepID=A0A7W1YG22_9LIST|nr:L-ribulose-5-phosphate 3-epimerase [Listeria rustica]MBA3926236.1 L-ribulose-5-phosphate 3-epimerase [Listeria rustica]
MANPLGIYEKALPADLDWMGRLEMAGELGFDFVEMSIDETDVRLARLDWTAGQRREIQQAIFETGVRIPSICLSGHRRFPLGSHDSATRAEGMILMRKAIDLASDIGVRVIQLAGYDVYYEAKDVGTRNFFIENLRQACDWAAAKQVTLAIEVMDDPFMSSISKYLEIKAQIVSPWLQVYPDIGNVSAWPQNDIGRELAIGLPHMAGVHLKDTLAVTADFPGKFKNVAFGAGCVDFGGCLRTLKSNGYAGPFLIEMWSETSDDPRREIREALAFLMPKMKEAGYDDVGRGTFNGAETGSF